MNDEGTSNLIAESTTGSAELKYSDQAAQTCMEDMLLLCFFIKPLPVVFTMRMISICTEWCGWKCKCRLLHTMALFSSQKFSIFSVTSNLWSHAWSIK